MAGGTSASKTITILMALIDLAQTRKGLLVSVVSESIPHLRKGAMRDFESIMREQGYWSDGSWSKTEFIYTYGNGSRIEFFGADSPDKVRGPRRDVLYINECNNVPFQAYEQLEVRTKRCVYLDWNPTNEFWFYTEVQANPLLRDDIDFITLTYRDNEALDPAIVRSIESRRENRAWWTVYGLGMLGESEARVYTGWQIVDEVPHEARLWRRGLDFGYTNDPSGILDCYQYNGGLIFDEQLYQAGLTNRQLADFVKNLPEPNTLIKADSAEPKSIDELSLHGLTVLGAQKGPGSVSQGIQRLQGMRVSVTKRSVNLIREYRNLLWETDRDGRVLNVPMAGNDHLLDPARYIVEDYADPRPRPKARYEGGNRLGYGRRPVFGDVSW